MRKEILRLDGYNNPRKVGDTMIYVMSDLHGCYHAYRQMLETLALGPRDTLYLLGDLIDRGPQPIDILVDAMSRSNVIPLAGNHEYMACRVFAQLDINDSASAIEEKIQSGRIEDARLWLFNGGDPTLEQYKTLAPRERQCILDYLSTFHYYSTVDVSDRLFLMVHAGLGRFSPNKPITHYTASELIWERPDYDRVYFDDMILVTGHTPTCTFAERKKVFFANNHLAIDCGSVFTGTLGAVCLDTMKAYYVNWEVTS